MKERDARAVISKRIKCKMNILHINQRILSERTGIPKQTISRYLNGERKPTFDMIIKIASALGCSTGDLLDLDEPLE